MPYKYHTEHCKGTHTGVFTYKSPNNPVISTNDLAVTEINRALDGDIVEYILNDNSAIITNIVKRNTNRIVGVLQLNNTKIQGTNSKGSPQYLMTPLSWRYPKFIVAFKAKNNFTVDQFVMIEFKEWLTTQRNPRGNMMSIVGSVTDQHSEDLSLLYKNHLYFKKHQLALTIETVPESPELIANNVIVIDPEGSTDFDDGYSVNFSDNQLLVHIADPNYFLNDSYDNELMKRITSIYGHKVYHMLPELYATKLSSLNKDGVKPVISVIYEITDNQLSFKEVKIGYIKVVHQLTYNKAQIVNDNGNANIDSNFNANFNYLIKTFKLLESLSGSRDVHKMIEYLMITTNCSIAKFMEQHGIRFARYCEQSEQLHNSEISPYLLKKTSKAAIYTTKYQGHSGLGLTYYTHFTSPIRRWFDFLTHRVVKSIVTGSIAPSQQFLEDQCELINRHNNHLKRYYRDRNILLFYRHLHSQPQPVTMKGYIVGFNHGYIEVYFKDLELEYKYLLFAEDLQTIIDAEQSNNEIVLTNKQTKYSIKIPMYQQHKFILTTLSHEIRLNKKIIMRLKSISSWLTSVDPF